MSVFYAYSNNRPETLMTYKKVCEKIINSKKDFLNRYFKCLNV